MSNLNYIHVFFENIGHSYVTDLSIKTTVESVTEYFLNTSFDVGNYPIENMHNCVGFHFFDKNNNKDHFVGNCSQSNLEKFGLVTCHDQQQKIKNMNISTRYRFENPTLNDAIKNGFKVRQGDDLKGGQIGSPSQLAHGLNYALVKLPWGFGLTKALYDDKGELVVIGNYNDILTALKGA